MKIKKDESGNTWIDGELCINIPVKVKHATESKVFSYEELINFVGASIDYYISNLRNG